MSGPPAPGTFGQGPLSYYSLYQGVRDEILSAEFQNRGFPIIKVRTDPDPEKGFSTCAWMARKIWDCMRSYASDDRKVKYCCRSDSVPAGEVSNFAKCPRMNVRGCGAAVIAAPTAPDMSFDPICSPVLGKDRMRSLSRLGDCRG